MPWIQMAALIETPHYSVTQSLSQEPSALGQEGYRVSIWNMKKNVCLFVCNWSLSWKDPNKGAIPWIQIAALIETPH